ncbi:MAG: hypothetical protein EAY75_04190 [Bacteroidetes bacterium]|nr:MAG: hypothetical protein EAY75_04190 [Bacteroidota bacterium]
MNPQGLQADDGKLRIETRVTGNGLMHGTGYNMRLAYGQAMHFSQRAAGHIGLGAGRPRPVFSGREGAPARHPAMARAEAS